MSHIPGCIRESLLLAPVGASGSILSGEELSFAIMTLAKQAKIKPLDVVGAIEYAKQLYIVEEVIPLEKQQKYDYGSIK